MNDFKIGTLSKKVSTYLNDIQYGSIPDPYGWVVRVI